jgi:GNAT superfamily N-acetyltransferase
MAPEIRRASRSDVDAIVEMVRSFYAESAYPFDAAHVFAAVDGLLSDPRRGRAWVVVDEGAPVGYGVLTYGYSIEYGGVDAFVDELWIAPALRGGGLGTRILDLVDEECVKKSVGALHLEVERENPAAERMYRARGFVGGNRRLVTKRFD